MSSPAVSSLDVEGRPAVTQPAAPVGRSKAWRLVLAGIMLVATLIRLPGVLWGLPHELHPDEPVITANAIDLITRHSLVPQVFYRPDHLEILLSSFAYRVYAWFSGTSAPVDFTTHPGRYLAISRGITVAFSVAAIPLAWCVGRRFGPASAVFAALLVAFFPPFVANSSYATPDMPLTCLMLAVVLASMRYLESPTWLDVSLGSAAVGAGVTVKYPAAIAAAMVGLVVLIVMVRSRSWWRGVRHLLLAPVVFLLTVLVISHALITDLSAVMFQLHNQRGSDHPGAEALGWPGNLLFYVKDYASWAGVVLLAAAVVGAWWCVRQRAVIAVPLLLGVVYWIGLSEVPAHWERWALPMFLSPLLFAAVGLGRVWMWVAAIWRKPDLKSRLGVVGLSAAVTAVTAVAAAQLFAGNAVVIAGFAGRDTRVAAMPEFRAAGIDKTTAIYDGYTPVLPGAPWLISFNLQIVKGHLYVVRKPGARYVVMSSDMYNRYTRDRYEKVWAVYQGVRGQMPLMEQWTPVPPPRRSVLEFFAVPRALHYAYRIARGGEAGPTIAVYQIPRGVAHS